MKPRFTGVRQVAALAAAWVFALTVVLGAFCHWDDIFPNSLGRPLIDTAALGRS